jgi:hypothetical protein
LDGTGQNTVVGWITIDWFMFLPSSNIMRRF